jgi:hypothetical protein
MARPKTDPIIRFQQKYVIDKETGCWNWIAGMNDKEYGNFRVEDKIIKAHRFSYEYFIGPLDANLEICHNCNNSKCVNPMHLRQDTRKSNMIDKSYAGPNKSQILSVDEIIQIKKELLHPYYGQQKDLAHFYKVRRQTINEIKMGRNWSHVEVER